MSVYIDNGADADKRRESLQDFVKNSKIGECHQVGGTYGNTYTHYMFINTGPDKVVGYHTSRWGATDSKPSFIFSKLGLKYVKRPWNSKQKDKWHDEFRNFVKMGFIPNIKVEFVREHTMITCDNTEGAIPVYRNMALSWEGKLLSSIPAEIKKLCKEVNDNNKNVRNRNARARYHNKRVIALMDEHRYPDETNDNGVIIKKGNLKDGQVPGTVPMDVFSLINVAYRTALIESFTMEKVLEAIDHDVVDEKVIDKRPYELLRFEMPFKQTTNGDAVIATYLKMINPSTGEYCVEGVPNSSDGSWRREITMNTVEQALAWRDGDGEVYNVPRALA